MKRNIVYIIILMAVAAAGLLCAMPGQVSGYEPKGKRDPFIPLVGQEKASRPAGLEGIISIQDVLLEGIAIGPSGKNIAILNGQMVKEKDKFGVLEVKKISKKMIELSIEGKDFTLSLQDEEGIKIGK
ncbi:MAG: hypothetical protein Q7S30_03980 [Candidatus Omnitrophota bacterium]|nr:hypothetical protein [Candidatus Omnitrophota bacterium]